jgi:hypothetical protein
VARSPLSGEDAILAVRQRTLADGIRHLTLLTQKGNP